MNQKKQRHSKKDNEKEQLHSEYEATKQKETVRS